MTKVAEELLYLALSSKDIESKLEFSAKYLGLCPDDGDVWS